MRVAIIGAGGQLGAELVRFFGQDAVPFTHQDLELTDRTSVVRSLQQATPDAVINAAAYNFVDRAEDEPQQAFLVNAVAVRYVAEVCRELGVPLVHFSTDYVFGLDEHRREPYREIDCPGPVNCYGASKLAGEYLALATWSNSYIVRTCGVYGTRGREGKGYNFVEKMLKLAQERAVVRVVNDQQCSPTYAVDLAEATAVLLEVRPPYGIYHVTNEGSCTWYEFACEVFRAAGLTVPCEPIRSEDYPSRARRPRYSVLARTRWVASGLPRLRPWQEALRAYLAARAGR
jgi:dTDP-4-dehydrorhamnose reductase